jgi:hypothetical protein
MRNDNLKFLVLTITIFLAFCFIFYAELSYGQLSYNNNLFDWTILPSYNASWPIWTPQLSTTNLFNDLSIPTLDLLTIDPTRTQSWTTTTMPIWETLQGQIDLEMDMPQYVQPVISEYSTSIYTQGKYSVLPARIRNTLFDFAYQPRMNQIPGTDIDIWDISRNPKEPRQPFPVPQPFPIPQIWATSSAPSPVPADVIWAGYGSNINFWGGYGGSMNWAGYGGQM